MLSRIIATTVLGVMTTLSALAGSPSPVLIPTIYNGPGAYGSRWTTAVVLNNHETTPLSSPGVRFNIVLCPIPEGCSSDSIPAGAFGQIESPAPANGLLLYLPNEDAHVSFMGRFASTPRNALSGGTELPVVKEREFTNSRIDFPYVPLGSFPNPVRTLLRVYAPDAQPGTAVKVELRRWDIPEGSPEFSTTLALDSPAQPYALPIYPGYAQLALQIAFPDAARMGASYNVSVVPLPLDSTTTPRIWAFLTITDNVTQEVTLQRPQ